MMTARARTEVVPHVLYVCVLLPPVWNKNLEKSLLQRQLEFNGLGDRQKDRYCVQKLVIKDSFQRSESFITPGEIDFYIITFSI